MSNATMIRRDLSEVIQEAIGREVAETMQAYTDKAIEQATAQIAEEMQRKTAQITLSVLSEYDVSRDGQNLMIKVRQEPAK